MPSFAINTPQRSYPAVVERGVLERLGDCLPARTGKVFVVTTADVWQHHATRLARGLANRSHEIMLFPDGEERKRLASVEALAGGAGCCRRLPPAPCSFSSCMLPVFACARTPTA